MKQKIVLILSGWIILYFIFFHLMPYLTDRNHGCYIHQEIYNQDIQAVVLKKYMDAENHNNKTIIYKDKNHSQGYLISTADNGDIYDFVDAGDSIIKKKNSITYRLRYMHTLKDTLIKFETFCQDSLKKQINNF